VDEDGFVSKRYAVFYEIRRVIVSREDIAGLLVVGNERDRKREHRR